MRFRMAVWSSVWPMATFATEPKKYSYEYNIIYNRLGRKFLVINRFRHLLPRFVR